MCKTKCLLVLNLSEQILDSTAPLTSCHPLTQWHPPKEPPFPRVSYSTAMKTYARFRATITRHLAHNPTPVHRTTAKEVQHLVIVCNATPHHTCRLFTVGIISSAEVLAEVCE